MSIIKPSNTRTCANFLIRTPTHVVINKGLIFWPMLLGFIIDIELSVCFYITYLYFVQTKYLNISKVS